MPKVVLPLTLSLAFALASAFPFAAKADTVTLKSGETYEGTVVSQTETEVVMLVRISGGITDEQTFQKEEISELLTTPEDAIEYGKLSRYEIGPHSKTPASYNLAIAAYENFASRYPESSHKAGAEEQIRQLKEERARVARKEVKINSRWYTQQQIKEEHYQISAQRLLQVINDQAAKGDLVGALNSFDKLETEYPGSAAYPQAVPIAIALIQRLRAEITRAVPIAKDQQRKFDEGIVHTREPEKSRMLTAQKSNIARAEAAFSQSSAKWKPFFAAMDQSVNALNTTIESEYVRLQTIDLTSMARSLQLTDQGRDALLANETTEAATRLEEAKTAWKDNEAATRLKAAIDARIAQEEEAAKEAAAAEAEAQKATEEKKPAGAKGKSRKG